MSKNPHLFYPSLRAHLLSHFCVMVRCHKGCITVQWIVDFSGKTWCCHSFFSTMLFNVLIQPWSSWIQVYRIMRPTKTYFRYLQWKWPLFLLPLPWGCNCCNFTIFVRYSEWQCAILNDLTLLWLCLLSPNSIVVLWLEKDWTSML